MTIVLPKKHIFVDSENKHYPLDNIPTHIKKCVNTEVISDYAERVLWWDNSLHGQKVIGVVKGKQYKVEDFTEAYNNLHPIGGRYIKLCDENNQSVGINFSQYRDKTYGLYRNKRIYVSTSISHDDYSRTDYSDKRYTTLEELLEENPIYETLLITDKKNKIINTYI